MGILVLYNNNVYDVVDEERLDALITEKKIVGFHRSDEWVTVGGKLVKNGGRVNGKADERER